MDVSQTDRRKGNQWNSAWASEHDEALKKYLALGLSFSQIAVFINDEFGTHYSRNATIGRAARKNFEGPGKTFARPRAVRRRPQKNRVYKPVQQPERPSTEQVALRCAEIVPRNLTLLELGRDDCRYPYGEGPFTFCGHAKADGCSYCTAHFFLSFGPGTVSERAAGRMA